ncbi:MAG TPA: RES family NAD+ phosphorylase [Bacteroidales bacterium]|jgi:RES domain-containing protein|nr:RES family NAD+ phosphorylase [Bacteroidales bacterium]
MIVFRLSKAAYADDLSGRGAELTGGRWNSKGTAMVFTSESRALCAVEIAVHIPLGILPLDYLLITIEIPDRIRYDEVSPEDLPDGWNSMPYGTLTRKTGDNFVKEMKSAVMKVPSAVIPGEFNFLVNPKHPDSSLITIRSTQPFKFDSRLFL